MTRISRITAPRATSLGFALLTMAMWVLACLSGKDPADAGVKSCTAILTTDATNEA